MKRFSDSIKYAVNSKNWLGALSLSLTMPDICGRLENPTLKSGARYVPWFEKWVQPKYSHRIGPDRRLCIFMTGEDCYALRCSYLHEGGDDISTQKIRKAIDSFHFIAPRNGMMIHCNKSNDKLQLQVDIFSLDIADAVERWSDSVKENTDIQERIKSLIVVHNSDDGVYF